MKQKKRERDELTKDNINIIKEEMIESYKKTDDKYNYIVSPLNSLTLEIQHHFLPDLNTLLGPKTNKFKNLIMMDIDDIDCNTFKKFFPADLDKFFGVVQTLYNEWQYNANDENKIHFERLVHGGDIYKIVRITDIIMWPINTWFKYRDTGLELIKQNIYEKIKLASGIKFNEITAETKRQISNLLTKYYLLNYDLLNRLQIQKPTCWIEFIFQYVFFIITLLRDKLWKMADRLTDNLYEIIEKCFGEHNLINKGGSLRKKTTKSQKSQKRKKSQKHKRGSSRKTKSYYKLRYKLR